MGLPTFFRWISERYPKCVADAIKPDPQENLVKANPNEEVDNLYIDINDILHIAFHPEEAKTPDTFEECMTNLTLQIEDIVRIARPRQMIFIAFDGVAPKAKLNLQRKRRFEKYKSSAISKKRMANLQIYRQEAGLEECEVPKSASNSNCLSPGTQFMFDASNYLSNWIQMKQLQDSFWTGLHVILSDSSSPGEGEHKIMQHIRRMRKEPGYKPNTRHVVVGRDADLILLALTTHEPNFRILRQVCYYGKMLKCPMCFRHGHCRDCVYPPAVLPDRPEHDFVFFDINIFRQCFEEDIMQVQPDINIENVVNDFVLITFFLGNDFLPKIPGLSIRSGGLELLIETYKTHLMINKQYLTESNGDLCALALRDYLILVSNREPDLITQEFRINRRCIKALKKKCTIYQKNKVGNFDSSEGSETQSEVDSTQSKSIQEEFLRSVEIQEVQSEPAVGENVEKTEDVAEEENVEGKEEMDDFPDMTPEEIRKFLIRLDELFPLASFENTSVPWFNGLTLEQQLRYLDLTMYVVPPRMRDSQLKIPYGMHWKRTYYNARFGIKLPKSVAKTKAYVQHGEIRKILNEYMRGFIWCWKYYTSENPDWEWFYPHHYGPCMTDLTRCILKDVHFPENSKPLDPLVYLMALLPVSDAHIVPPAFRHLINSEDSPILDFYPKTCTIDYSEAYVFWQGICQLPFIDFNRMKAVCDPLVATLADEYKHLNRVTNPRMFVASVMDLGSTLLKFYGEDTAQPVESFDLCSVNPREQMEDHNAITLKDDEECSTMCKVVYPIRGFTPLSSEDHSFKSLVAYILPLAKEEFSMKLLPGCVVTTPDILANQSGIAVITNYRRFGTLRKIWYKALQDQRSRMTKEKKVLGYFSPEEQEPSIIDQMKKKDPARATGRRNDMDFEHLGTQAFQNSFNSGGRVGGRNQNQGDRNPSGSQIEHLLKIMVQQKLTQMMAHPNPNMPELVSMMQSYISLQMNSRSNQNASSMGGNSPSMQQMMQQMQLLNMMQSAMGVNPMSNPQMVNGGMQQNPNSGMPGMQANPGMMKNFGAFNQVNMQNSPMMSGMNGPMPNMMGGNQQFGGMGAGAGIGAGPAPMMQQQQAAMSGGGMPSPTQAGLNQNNVQRMMSSFTHMQEEMNQLGTMQKKIPHLLPPETSDMKLVWPISEGEAGIHEPGATNAIDKAFDPNSFNQRFQTNNQGFNQMGAMGSTPPPQQSNFSFSNYQPVMKQVHTPDAGGSHYNPPTPQMQGTPQFSPNQNFNFPTMNSFQNAGFQTQPPRSPGGPYGASSPGPTAGPPAPPGMNQAMWPNATPTGYATTPTGPAPNFPNQMSQFVPHGTSQNRNGFNKMNQQFNRNYVMNNYNAY